jgi:NAD(P)H dehydrogenase (quinone)
MKILAVFCHPMRDSFTGEILDNFVQGARDAGHEVEIADLYREGFQPVMQERDYAQFDGLAMPDDVLAEQARFERCEAFALIFPVWWWSFPAMLKGWIDRVFTAGWAFALSTDDQGRQDDPEDSLLTERKAVVLCCAGGSERMYEKYGTRDALTSQIEVGTMEYCGVTDVTTHILYKAWENDEPRRAALRNTAYAAGKEFS